MLLRLLRQESAAWQARTDVPLAWMTGKTELLRDADVVNNAVARPDAYVWLVGSAAVFYVARPMHYTVVFNRDPWLEFAQAAQNPAVAVAWLRTRNVTHVVFSWPEITRLRRTYGFAPLATRGWVRELAGAGLRRILPDPAAPDSAGVEVYEVLPE
jgi:hypothetical protein